MDKEKINYFIYARKSTEGEDRQVLSIDGQLNDNQQVIMRNGLQVIDTIIDDASAAIPYNRPGYTDMIRRIKKGEASGIVVWHIDRLVRNELEDGEFRWLLQTGVIKSIWTPNREYRSADNALLISIEASMAAQYSRDLAVKVKRGLRQKWEQGQPCGFAKIGYLNTKLQAHGTNYIIEDPERFHIVRKGFDLLLSGKYDVPHIHAKLTNEYGLVTRKSKKLGGKPIALSVLYRTFTDPFYSGRFYRDGILYKGAYKPMITIDEYNRIQAILGRPNKAKPKKHEFAFTGLMNCGSCGCAITASRKLKIIKATGEYKTYTFYHCTKRKGKSMCDEKHYTTEKEMVAIIANEIAKLNLIPIWKEWAVNTLKEDYEFELSKDKELLKSTLDFERRLQGELDRLIDLRISNEISEEKYRQKKTERQAELLTVQEKIKRMQNSVMYQQEQIDEILNFVENIDQRFLLADPKEQRSICTYLGWNWVLRGKKLTFTKQNWFFDLEELKGYYEANKGGLEPIKTFIEFRQSPYFERVLLTLRRMREHIRTMPHIKTDDLEKEF